jgi:hypothetical protein
VDVTLAKAEVADEVSVKILPDTVLRNVSVRPRKTLFFKTRLTSLVCSS